MALKRPRHPFKGIADSLHIKGNTAGTSNELSLSVLDERSKNAGEKESSTPRPARVNKVSVFAVQAKRSRREKTAGNASPKLGIAGRAHELSARGRADRARKRALDDPEGEIKRRKTARRVRRVLATTCGLVSAIALLAALSYGVWNHHQKSQENLTLLEQAMSELEAADKIVLAADAFVTEGIGETPSEELDQLVASADDARTHANAAIAFADSAYEKMGESTDREVAAKVKSSAETREAMLDGALSIISLERQARDASGAIQECWQLVLSADGLLKEAAALVTETTSENVRASQEKSEEALGMLDQALAELAAAQGAYSSADFSLLSSYIEKRMEAIGYAIASDEAIYIQDKATADTQNALYNEADAEAVEIARKLPDDPKKPIADAFEQDTGQMRSGYLEMREAAAQSDAFIRDYLSAKR